MKSIVRQTGDLSNILMGRLCATLENLNQYCCLLWQGAIEDTPSHIECEKYEARMGGFEK